MNFAEQIRQFKKGGLKNVNTIVTTALGEHFIESHTMPGVTETQKLTERSEGFVVDESPDLQIVPVRPNLFVGSSDVANSFEILKENGITHILNLIMMHNAFPEDFTYLSLPICDLPTVNIRRYFAEAFKFIDDALLTGGKVLVHCNAGVSRCITITLAYLIKMEKAHLHEELAKLREVRYVKPNAGFMKILEEFNEEIHTKKIMKKKKK
ncbi:Dual specificity protein phosphatase 19 [Holothuria leucospilota]|uniref:Dual specificity protein phosphatase 19 n=1 Tax=Holothuria leucospilota TaxID=206669 RepID=A0A9Q0YNI2_HOLLE|nr:Dual specificity protein phosphatase 19 [Holothuria leucospilota]